MDDASQQQHLVLRVELEVRHWKRRFWTRRLDSIGGKILADIENQQAQALQYYRELTIPVPNQPYRWVQNYEVFSLTDALNIPCEAIKKRKQEFRDSWGLIQIDWVAIFPSSAKMISSLECKQILDEYTIERRYVPEVPLGSLLGSLSIGSPKGVPG